MAFSNIFPSDNKKLAQKIKRMIREKVKGEGVDEWAVEVFVAGVSRVASTECDRFNFFCNNENDTPSFNQKIA